MTPSFRLSADPIDGVHERSALESAATGACVVFEGRVRDRNDGRRVLRLDYQAYAELAEREGAVILAEACERFDIVATVVVHRVGRLDIGDVAVWVGVGAAHRDAAFTACRFIVDEVKRRVPIWKNEHYADGESGWLHPDPQAPVGD
jgi:molybdopterin synthase catalytic subunit